MAATIDDSSALNGSEYHVSPTEGTLTTEMPLTQYTLSDIVIISILVIGVIIVIVVGNAIVVGLVVINRRQRPIQNLFIASLAFSDLFVGLLIMPLSLVNELIGYWCFGMVLCELWLAFDVLLCTASILNLCLISVDRYLCITHAMSYPGWRTKQRAMWMIAVVWLLAMLVCFPPLVGWKRPQPMKNNLPLCVLSSEVGYVVYSTLASFFIPLFVMVAVYVQIYRAVRHQMRRRYSIRYDASAADSPHNQPHKEEICRIIRHREDERDGDLQVAPSDDDFEELEMDLVAYERTQEEDDGDNRSHRICVGTEANDPNEPPMVSDEEAEQKSVADETTSWVLEQNAGNCPQPSPIRTHPPATSPRDVDPHTHSASSETGSAGIAPEVAIDASSSSELPTSRHPQASSDSGINAAQESHMVLETGCCALNSTVTKKAKRETVTVYRLWRWHPRHRHPNGVFCSCFGQRHHKIPLIKESPCKKKDQLPDSRKGRIVRARERRLTVILGVIMATFVFCWFPFFSTYLVSSLTGLPVPKPVFDVFFWGGYCNSALNPIIYTIFNRDIRLCKSRGP